jgi:AraC-like DNA-binding protein
VKLQARRRNIHFGKDHLAFMKEMPRHQHIRAYATVVLGGEFEQFSYAGRLTLQAGDVLINPTLDCHSNRMRSRAGVTLVRLPWRHDGTFGGVYRRLPIDVVVAMADRDPGQAAGLLQELLAGESYACFQPRDWCDQLALDLGANPRLHIGHWATMQGVTREYAWRSFSRTFAVGPGQFRVEVNSRAALMAIVRSDAPLSKVAVDCGFSDQSHMSRAIKALTGMSPARCRYSHWFKTHLSETARAEP